MRYGRVHSGDPEGTDRGDRVRHQAANHQGPNGQTGSSAVSSLRREKYRQSFSLPNAPPLPCCPPVRNLIIGGSVYITRPH
ncbi:hypothetical protein SKAU_G00364230 [Synaphobranchus kaupii]|uniref:Uncharacterized protein n=1 Tax=Synaphobranchus kaupii TaxID=118154 RepID=A0A9Q1IF57_SYNKA|nr:hypothetical protein SKAU_G00364230 [Synaphobranchus kaupii]